MTGKKFLAIGALAVLASSLGLGAPLPVASASAAVASSPVAAAAAGHLKAFAAGDVAIDAGALAHGVVTVTSDPVAGLATATVRVAASGDARVTSGGEAAAVPSDESARSASVALSEAATAPADLSQAALADATGSVVEATLSGTTADGTTRSSSDTVWVDEFAGTVLVSETGEQDLRLQRVDVLRRSGAVTADEADALDEAILGATASTESVTEVGCSSPNVCVSGTVLWTDSAGGTHPVDRAPVQIRDAEPGADAVVTTVTTNGAGSYNATIDNNDGDATGRDVYVRVLANGPGFTLAQHIDSGVTTDAVTGTEVTKNLTANNTLDNNTAFAVHASLVFAGDEIVLQNGSLFATVPVVFPSDGSYYDGTSLNLLALDRWDWDVSLHEFGHYVADQLNIEANPGGFHSGSDNLSDSTGSKAIGIPLAWGEGWPTYFAVSTLHERAADAGIPNIGDTKYQDTEDQVVTDDLEATATLGEDNEVTDMAILWDLYDSVDDNRDHVSLGAAEIWDTLDDSDPTSLSAAYRLFSPGRATEGTNCIFTQMNVSPKISGTATTVTTATPTFRWKRGNGGSHPNNRFTVKFRSAGGALLFTSRIVSRPVFRPTPSRWASILGAAGGTVQVSVIGRQTDPPATGPYRSCTRVYTVE